MQGSESDVVIFDFCDSPPLSRLGKPLSGGLGSSGARLLCTAISRARGKLILVGDWQFLLSHSNGDAALRSVLDQLDTREIHALTATNAMSGSAADPDRISWYSESVSARRQLMRDICSARAHILINAPSPEDLAWIEPHWFDGHDPAFVLIRLTARTPELTLLYEEHGAISSHRPGPEFFIVVDSIIWRWPTGAERSGPIVRAQLETTSTFVRQLLGLDTLLELEV